MMHLLFGDSLVGYLAAHMGPDFHCESYPGWTSEQALREYDWTLGLVLTESKYASCVLLLGANDTGQQLSTPETIDALKQLRERVKPRVTNVWICGFPGEDPAAMDEAFGDAYIEYNEDLVDTEDGVHPCEGSAKYVAGQILDNVLSRF